MSKKIASDFHLLVIHKTILKISFLRHVFNIGEELNNIGKLDLSACDIFNIGD